MSYMENHMHCKPPHYSNISFELNEPAIVPAH